MTGYKSDTLSGDYLPDYKTMVNIQLKYDTPNTTYAFNRSAIFLPGSLPVFINGYSVPFSSYYMLVLLIDLHKQLCSPLEKNPLSHIRIFDR